MYSGMNPLQMAALGAAAPTPNPGQSKKARKPPTAKRSSNPLGNKSVKPKQPKARPALKPAQPAKAAKMVNPRVNLNKTSLLGGP